MTDYTENADHCVSAADCGHFNAVGSGAGHSTFGTQAASARPAPIEQSGQAVPARKGHCPAAGPAGGADTGPSTAGLTPRLPTDPGDAGERAAIVGSAPRRRAPLSRPSPQGARAATSGTATTRRTPRAADDDQGRSKCDAQEVPALIDDGEAEGHQAHDAHFDPDLRFSAPLILEIVGLWRQRQGMVRSMLRLTLAAGAMCRSVCGGDKTAGAKLLRQIEKGDLSHPAALAVTAILAGRAPMADFRASAEKALAKAAKRLPVAEQATAIRGVNHNTLAAIVGECGDLSAYRTVSGVWKRAGLAVIDGGRQRRVAGEAALDHGYSPARRSVFWNIGEALLKAQGKDDDAGPYRRVYDAEKAKALKAGLTAGHAHARGCRHMTKRLLRDLTVMWRN